MFDIPGQIRKAITGFLVWMAKTGLKPVMETLGSTALSTPDLTGNPQVKAVWTTTLVAANGIYVLFVVAGGFIVASQESLQTQYGFKQIARRLVLGAVISNVSLILCGKAIEFTNALTTAVAGQGVDGPAAAQAIVDMMAQPLGATSPNILFALLVIAMVVLALVVVITFLLRVALLVVLIGFAPLALACHATPQTEGLAYTWWRAFAACLGMQVAQALIVLTAVKMFLTPAGLTLLGVPASKDGLLGVLVCVTMLWLLIKLPGLLKQFVLSPLGLRSQGRGLFGQLLQAYMTFKTLGAVSGLSKGKRAIVAGATSGRAAATTSTARPVRGAGGQPMAPRPALSRPSPAGPVAFSHAPVTQTPLSAPASRTGAPAFSHPAPPATPAPASSGAASGARFSHPATAQPGQSRPANHPAPVAFSNATTAPASPPPAGPPPAATFSNPQPAQSAPGRPPAPFTPVFSSAPTTPAGRPTAARRPTAAPRRTSAASSTAPSPRPARSPTARPAPAAPPPSPPRPAGSTAPVFRPASSPPSPRPSPPSPPPARRQPRGGKP
ncbi:hypothetical protein [Krasilnikovia sp. MM14-A1259]|uniref:hypothetical protein n=1 Tax=Krasilnikovia sp. MM14-A1259 TaxID=3373539 RepID=UPI00399C9805